MVHGRGDDGLLWRSSKWKKKEQASAGIGSPPQTDRRTDGQTDSLRETDDLDFLRRN
jgi:hypothetical protein